MNIIEDINEQIKMAREGGQPVKNVSDCYHTFDELYRHRHALFLSFVSYASDDYDVWVTKHHHPDNDPMFDGMFLMGIELPEGSIQYHLPMSYWDAVDTYEILEHAPYYDGSDSPDNTVTRLEEALGL